MSEYQQRRSVVHPHDAAGAASNTRPPTHSGAIKRGPVGLQDVLNRRATLHAMVETAARAMDEAQRQEAKAFERRQQEPRYRNIANASLRAVIEFRSAFNNYRRFLADPTQSPDTLIKFRQLEALEDEIRDAEARLRDAMVLESHATRGRDERALHTARLSLDAFFRINSISARKGQQEEHQATEQGWAERMQRLSLGITQLGPEAFSKYLAREPDDTAAKLRRMSIADIAIRRAVAVHMLQKAGVANPVRLVELAQLSALGARHAPNESREVPVDKAALPKERPKADDLLEFVKVLSEAHMPNSGMGEMHQALDVAQGNVDVPDGQQKELEELREKMLDSVWDEMREGDKHGHARLHAQEAGRHGLPMDRRLARYAHLAEAYKIGTYLPAVEEQAGESVPRLFQMYREMLPELAATQPTATASVLVNALRGQEQVADLVRPSTMKLR